MNEFSLAKNVYLFQYKTETCLHSQKAQIDKSGNYVFQDADTIEFHTKRNNYDLVKIAISQLTVELITSIAMRAMKCNLRLQSGSHFWKTNTWYYKSKKKKK